MRRFVWILILAVLFGACSKKSNNKPRYPGDKPVASVYGNYLYMSDVEKAIPNGLSADDSLDEARNYINSWVEQQLLYNVAQQYLNDEQKQEIEQKVEDFRQSLYIHAFKRQLIKKELDTNVSMDLIAHYYEVHKQDFILSQPVIRGYWFKVPIDADLLPQIRSLAFSTDVEDVSTLKDMVSRAGGQFDDFRNDWRYFSDVMLKIPYVVSSPEDFLKNRRYLQTQDDYYYYFLKIFEYRLKGDNIPLSLCQNDIKRIILNHRSRELISQIEKKLYDQAVEKGDIKIYQ